MGVLGQNKLQCGPGFSPGEFPDAGILTRAGTTLLTGNPPSVSSLPITSSWHISIAAWSCWDSSPVACSPCSSCCAFEPASEEETEDGPLEQKKYLIIPQKCHKHQSRSLTSSTPNGPMKQLRHTGSKGTKQVRRKAPGLQQSCGESKT